MEVSLVWLELSVNHFKGLFSERHLEEINECTYDPPYAGKGATPGWAAGSTKQVKQITDGIPTETESYDSDYGYDDGYEYDYRKKRKRRFDMGGIYGGGKSVYQRLCRLFWTVFTNNNLGYGASDYGAGSDYGSEYGYDPYGGYGSDYDPVVLECLANDPSGGHDANAWIKTPGNLTTLSI